MIEKIDLPKDQSIHESDAAKKHSIDDLDILITASCGEAFQRKVKNRGITLIKTAEQDPLTAARQFIDGKPLAPAVTETKHNER